MKYQLTTDLIADCMALIPDNLKLLNESQKLFKLHFFEKSLYINFDNGDGYMLDYFLVDPQMYYSEECLQVAFLSHCLEKIPEFQTPIQRYVDLHFYANNQNIKHSIKELQLMNELMSFMPRTIASATLHGQGGNPPRTLKELCESYKNVMSKAI